MDSGSKGPPCGVDWPNHRRTEGRVAGVAREDGGHVRPVPDLLVQTNPGCVEPKGNSQASNCGVAGATGRLGSVGSQVAPGAEFGVRCFQVVAGLDPGGEGPVVNEEDSVTVQQDSAARYVAGQVTTRGQGPAGLDCLTQGCSEHFQLGSVADRRPTWPGNGRRSSGLQQDSVNEFVDRATVDLRSLTSSRTIERCLVCVGPHPACRPGLTLGPSNHLGGELASKTPFLTCFWPVWACFDAF